MNVFKRKHSAADEAREEKAREEFQEEYDAIYGFIKTDERAETIYNANLMRVGADLARGCHPNGASPQEMLTTYTQLMDGLKSWFNIVPIREKLEAKIEENIWTEWSPKEQPLKPTYTPLLKRKNMGNNGNPAK